MSLLLFLSIAQTAAAEELENSFNFGFLHPSGINLLGYTVEGHIDHKLYGYFTIGVPSLFAIGITHYSNHDGNGVTATLGAGLGYWLYASIAYQVKLGNKNFLKLGASLALATYYPYVSSEESYAFHTLPVVAYEYRF